MIKKKVISSLILLIATSSMFAMAVEEGLVNGISPKDAEIGEKRLRKFAKDCWMSIFHQIIETHKKDIEVDIDRVFEDSAAGLHVARVLKQKNNELDKKISSFVTSATSFNEALKNCKMCIDAEGEFEQLKIKFDSYMLLFAEIVTVDAGITFGLNTIKWKNFEYDLRYDKQWLVECCCKKFCDDQKNADFISHLLINHVFKK